MDTPRPPAMPEHENADAAMGRKSGLRQWLKDLRGGFRLSLAMTMVLAVALASYVTLNHIGQSSVSIGFLFILPACIGAFVARAGIHPADWTGYEIYWIPALLTILGLAAGAILFREGIICLVMIAPLWMGAAMLGIWPVHRYRRLHPHIDVQNIFRAQALLVLPMLALAIEPMIPMPTQEYVVTRSVDVRADTAQSWDALLNIRNISADEGRMTWAHSLLRIPRPLAATTRGDGVGAVRTGQWQDGIYFEERIGRWDAGRSLEWQYVFPDPNIHRHTDRHIAPRGEHLSVEDGGYRLIPLPGGGTRISLWTRYRLTSPVNFYAAWWGDLLLGDVQDNILAIVADRLTRQNDRRGGGSAYGKLVGQAYGAAPHSLLLRAATDYEGAQPHCAAGQGGCV